MYGTIYLITRSLFAGTYIAVPCLFLIQQFNIPLTLINKKALIVAANCVFLLGSVLFVLTIVSELFYSIFWGGEYEVYTVSNRYFGSFWITVCLLAIANLQPQVLWIKKTRQTSTISFLILCIWFLKYLVDMVFPDPGWHLVVKPGVAYYIGSCATYIIIISAIYYLYTKYAKDLEGHSFEN